MWTWRAGEERTEGAGVESPDAAETEGAVEAFRGSSVSLVMTPPPHP